MAAEHAAAMAALENEVRIAKERQRAEEERQRRENAEAEIAELKKQLAAKEASAKVMPSSASWGHQKQDDRRLCVDG